MRWECPVWFDAAVCFGQSGAVKIAKVRCMIRKFIGPLLLLAVIVIGDQIRIRRPDHKYRLTVEVETPQGMRSGSGVLSVHPDRGYARGGSTRTSGDAIVVNLGGGKTLLLLLAHRNERGIDLDEINYVALRAFGAAGQRAVFRRMDRVKGSVPVAGSVLPVFVIFSDASDPATMREVKPGDVEATLGAGIRPKGVSVEVVPNGWWPLDFGGVFGVPVTRGIALRLPWLTQPDGAARAVQAAALPIQPGADANMLFMRD